MRRYHDMGFLMGLPFEEFCDLSILASKKIQEEEIRAQWTALLPFMFMKVLKYMPFQEYLESCTGATVDMRPKEEIIAEIMALHGMESMEDGNI